MKIGLISDTHGMLRKEVIKNLDGCDLVIHAGDIGSIAIIEKLKEISRVAYIRGNCDKNSEFENIEKEKLIELDNIKIYVVHDIKTIRTDLNKLGINIVIFGHSHKKEDYTKNGILYINPGSVGPKRFNLPITMGILDIKENEMKNLKLEYIQL